MDLFDITLRLGASRKHSVRHKSTVLNVYIFRISLSGSSRSTPRGGGGGGEDGDARRLA